MAIFRRAGTPPPKGGVECRWGRQKSRFWAYIWLHCMLVPLQEARRCQHGRRWTATVLQVNCDTSLVVSGGVDCERRRRNVYNKKPQRYAKDNRTAHLTARSHKSVACVTNNKRFYSTFCTVEANYWQTRSIARPLCDSRATCIFYVSKCSKRQSSAFMQARKHFASWELMKSATRAMSMSSLVR